MYRNSPVRTGPRAKGIKVKNVLQVCLLVAVCFWLIFQVKRSHDKRKEFEASGEKVSLSSVTGSGEEIAKLGRKDLQPKLEKTGNLGLEDGGEREEEDDQDENKREDEEQDEDKVDEEKDDEIDENEQEKPDLEIEREEVDVVGEEKETEEGDEKENEDVSEEKDGQGQIENEEHTHEAREENYKADDASSAVTHTGRTLGTENEIKNGTIVENVGQTAENGTSTSPNTTLIQENESEPLVHDVSPASSIENGPPSDTTLVTSQSTETQTQNITAVTEESSNPTDTSNSEVTESNESTSKTELETETETENVTEGTEETVDPDEVQHDAIDSTDLTHLEEKDVRTDLDTLPDIETEGANNEDTAAE